MKKIIILLSLGFLINSVPAFTMERASRSETVKGESPMMTIVLNYIGSSFEESGIPKEEREALFGDIEKYLNQMGLFYEFQQFEKRHRSKSIKEQRGLLKKSFLFADIQGLVSLVISGPMIRCLLDHINFSLIENKISRNWKARLFSKIIRLLRDFGFIDAIEALQGENRNKTVEVQRNILEKSEIFVQGIGGRRITGVLFFIISNHERYMEHRKKNEREFLGEIKRPPRGEVPRPRRIKRPPSLVVSTSKTTIREIVEIPETIEKSESEIFIQMDISRFSGATPVLTKESRKICNFGPRVYKRYNALRQALGSNECPIYSLHNAIALYTGDIAQISNKVLYESRKRAWEIPSWSGGDEMKAAIKTKGIIELGTVRDEELVLSPNFSILQKDTIDTIIYNGTLSLNSGINREILENIVRFRETGASQTVVLHTSGHWRAFKIERASEGGVVTIFVADSCNYSIRGDGVLDWLYNLFVLQDIDAYEEIVEAMRTDGLL